MKQATIALLLAAIVAGPVTAAEVKPLNANQRAFIAEVALTNHSGFEQCTGAVLPEVSLVLNDCLAKLMFKIANMEDIVAALVRETSKHAARCGP